MTGPRRAWVSSSCRHRCCCSHLVVDGRDGIAILHGWRRIGAGQGPRGRCQGLIVMPGSLLLLLLRLLLMVLLLLLLLWWWLLLLWGGQRHARARQHTRPTGGHHGRHGARRRRRPWPWHAAHGRCRGHGHRTSHPHPHPHPLPLALILRHAGPRRCLQGGGRHLL